MNSSIPTLVIENFVPKAGPRSRRRADSQLIEIGDRKALVTPTQNGEWEYEIDDTLAIAKTLQDVVKALTGGK